MLWTEFQSRALDRSAAASLSFRQSRRMRAGGGENGFGHARYSGHALRPSPPLLLDLKARSRMAKSGEAVQDGPYQPHDKSVRRKQFAGCHAQGLRQLLYVV